MAEWSMTLAEHDSQARAAPVSARVPAVGLLGGQMPQPTTRHSCTQPSFMATFSEAVLFLLVCSKDRDLTAVSVFPDSLSNWFLRLKGGALPTGFYFWELTGFLFTAYVVPDIHFVAPHV